MAKILFSAAGGFNNNLNFLPFGGMKNCLTTNVIQRAVNNIVQLNVVRVNHIKNGDAGAFDADSHHAPFAVNSNYNAVFIAIFRHIKFLLMVVKRPLDLGGLVGECNNIRGESELRGDSSSVLTPCAMWGGL